MTIRNNRLPRIAANLEETVADAMDEGMKEVMKEAQRRVPQPGTGKGYATGDLKKGIKVVKVSSGGRYSDRAVMAGSTKAWYGHIVEFGSVSANQPAQPFLIPSFEKHKGKIEERMQLALKRLVEKGTTAG